ncbi:hypothetical protein AURDEDRAFT_168430 [Auricularia subglabra TFB-10046 SS5]|nr:hypothetical protein AURDEDRAFT_168430 [Auricularia subglabra TFB-10046 SS5]
MSEVRLTHAIAPADFSDDALTALASTTYRPRVPPAVPNPNEALVDVLARTRAKPAQLNPRRMADALDPNPSTRVGSPVGTDKSRRASRPASAAPQEEPVFDLPQDADEPDDPDDDGDDGDDDGHDQRGGRGHDHRNRGNHYANGRSSQRNACHCCGGGGGGGDGGPQFTGAHGDSGRQGGFVLDTRVKLESLPAWDGNERTALDYFSRLNEWARARKDSELFHQIPLAAPLRFTGVL